MVETLVLANNQDPVDLLVTTNKHDLLRFVAIYLSGIGCVMIVKFL